MIRVARPTVLVLGAALALTALTGCTPNVVNDAQSWLDGQPGVEWAEVVVDRTSLFETSGVIRGELEAGLVSGRLDLLVESAIDYARDHPGVEFRLGYNDVDFRIADVPATTTARGLWRNVSHIDGIVAAVIDADLVHAYVLRPDVDEVLGALRGFTVPIEVEAFRTEDDMVADRRDDDYGPLQRGHGSLQVLRGRGCLEPSEDAWSRALVATGFDAIDEGTADVCGGYDLVYRSETDLTVVALEWAEYQQFSADPASAFTVSESAEAHHEIQITPGDATLIPVVAALEAPGAPLVQYALAGDTLTVEGWDSPPTTVFDLVAGSPLAARLTSITIGGDAGGAEDGGSIQATGTLDQISTLIAEAEALIPLHESFYSVAITPEAVRISLYSPPGSDPDMVSAAAALRTSQIWTIRPTYVDYLNGYVLIENGVATVGDDYTDREPYDAFAAEWNAG